MSPSRGGPLKSSMKWGRLFPRKLQNDLKSPAILCRGGKSQGSLGRRTLSGRFFQQVLNPHRSKPRPCNMPQAKTEVALQLSECCAAETALQHWLFCSAEVIWTKSCAAANEKLHCNIEKAALQESGAFLPLSCGFQAPTFRHPRFGPADFSPTSENRKCNRRKSRHLVHSGQLELQSRLSGGATELSQPDLPLWTRPPPNPSPRT